MSERDLSRVWCDARPRLNAACDANDRYEPPLWLIAAAIATWVFVADWVWVRFVQ